MNKSIILTREQCEESLDAINDRIRGWEEDGDEGFLEPIEILTGMVNSINSQLNSNSIQEAWESMLKPYESRPADYIYKGDIITFLKTIGVEV